MLLQLHSLWYINSSKETAPSEECTGDKMCNALCKLIIEEELKVVKTDSQENVGILIGNLKRIHSVSRQNNFFGAP